MGGGGGEEVGVVVSCSVLYSSPRGVTCVIRDVTDGQVFTHVSSIWRQEKGGKSLS